MDAFDVRFRDRSGVYVGAHCPRCGDAVDMRTPQDRPLHPDCASRRVFGPKSTLYAMKPPYPVDYSYLMPDESL